MHNFKELNVWKKGIEMVTAIYELTSKFPSDEKFGLTSQIRRAAISIPSNIAEGSGRKTNKDFSNFLSISLGSQFELETQLIVASQLGFVSNEAIIFQELNELQKMTRGLINKLKSSV